MTKYIKLEFPTVHRNEETDKIDFNNVVHTSFYINERDTIVLDTYDEDYCMIRINEAVEEYLINMSYFDVQKEMDTRLKRAGWME